MSSCQGLTQTQIVELSSCFRSNINWNNVNTIVPGANKGTEQQKFQKVTHALNEAFENLEREGFFIYDPANPIHKPYIEDYKKRFNAYNDAKSLLFSKVQQLKNLSPELTKELQALESNFFGMLYSFGNISGGLDKRKNPDPQALETLESLALAWKNADDLIIDKNLNVLEKQQLEEAAKFPEWVEMIKINKEIAERFFKWAIRDYNPVDVFVMCPNVQARICYSLLSSTIGRVRKPGQEEILKFEREARADGVFRRILTLPFYHGDYTRVEKDKIERIDILDPRRIVHFKKGNYKVSLQEIEEKGSQRNDIEVIFNFCAAGMVNYHPTEGGHWDAEQGKFIKAADENRDNWTNFVPFADIISHTDLVKKYGNQMNNRTRVVQIISTRQATNFQVMKTHAFWRFLIRMNEDQWKVVEPGFYPDEYPTNAKENAKFFLNTRKRVMARNDQNGSYAFRQTGIYTPAVDEGKVEKLLKRVYREGTEERVFQFGGRNCTYPIDTLSKKYLGEENVPFSFSTSISTAKTGTLLDKVIGFFDRRWGPIRTLGLHLCFAFFGYWRSIKIKNKGKIISRSMFEFTRKNPAIKIYHPGLLVSQIAMAKKESKGPLKDAEFYWGNTSPKL